MSGEQIEEHLVQAFQPKIKAQFLEIDDIQIAIGGAQVNILLFKSDLPQSTSPSMLAHMTESIRTQALRRTSKMKQSVFHEAFYKIGIDLEGLTRASLKTVLKYDHSQTKSTATTQRYIFCQTK